MDGLDCLGTHEVKPGTFLGFDYMSLIKGGAGMLSGAGGMFGGGGGGAQPDAAAAAERARQAEATRKAEKSATTWKIIGGGVLGLAAVGGIAAVALRRPVP